jgi:methyltransferase (TIGR00027 family)
MRTEEKPIRSALMVAAFRALGTRDPNPEHRNPDHIAPRFIGRYEHELLANLPVLTLFDLPEWPAVADNLPAMAHVLRTRHIDHEFQAAMNNGSAQAVILGAGLDTRALRLTTKPVYEVDLPVTQEYKKRRLSEIQGSLPEHVRYVPIDFTRQTLDEVLHDAGWDRSKPTLFLWEGVSYYLTPDQVSSVLQFVSGHAAAGSGILFDYLEPRVVEGRHDDELWKRLVALLESWGEPFLSAIDECEREPFLQRHGLRLVHDYTLGEIAVRHCPQLPYHRMGVGRTGYHFCLAEV